MAFHDRKRVTFDEPLLVEVIEDDSEKFELPADEKRTRNRKFMLWTLVAVFVGLLIIRPPRKCTSFYSSRDRNTSLTRTHLVRHCAHSMHRHVKHKYAHLVLPAESVPKAIVKPSILNVERPQHVEHHYKKRADNGPLCTSTQCTNFAQSIKANLAANYTAIDPCEDFSTYVCGGWRDKHDYRADQACEPCPQFPPCAFLH
jgi:hypothetical protein